MKNTFIPMQHYLVCLPPTVTRFIQRMLVESIVLFTVISFSACGAVHADTVTLMSTTEVRLANALSTDRDSGIYGDVFGDTLRYFTSVRGTDSGMGGLQAFAVLDFQFDEPLSTVTDVNILSMRLIEETRYWTKSGDFEFYLLRNRSDQLTDASINVDGTPVYQRGQNGIHAIDPAFDPSTNRLATVSFVAAQDNHTPWDVDLTFSGDNQTRLLSAINNGERLRIGIAAAESTPDAGMQFLGSDALTPEFAPTLSFNVTAIPEPSALLLLFAGSAVAATRRRSRTTTASVHE
ncbi:PEP-CTERM sorting domain-containing protein [Rhodopirellula sp. MGV]|uniref:PEP-CTERM sorting domain-containing protein n=1 Tax=Rhodopirellula sp. MGV TaxID=2023130 RepID=UPI000B96F01C|nr:PEP-CTERM sorting domain-containing protein [Rhodopirellula sp. MGV]OYP38150.1 hypothetical protein CGZ80_02665 [Rhodopirellula sp. MGV]PNY38490.1 PEP-CTERM sorting domain-containing protein [Rhodopirellula baltica]